MKILSIVIGVFLSFSIASAQAQECGDGVCSPVEDPITCFVDCGDGGTCSDGIPNGFESDTDCGGPCPPCSDGQMCHFSFDCEGGFCGYSICYSGITCGDGVCSGFPEDSFTCPGDCSFGGGACGDGFCEPGENDTCPLDCPGGGCGDGFCVGDEPTTCPSDCVPVVCGDGLCDPLRENPFSCPADCPFGVCGDDICDPFIEDTTTCPADCGICGDTFCQVGESPLSCPEDCLLPGICGNGICEFPFESQFNCFIDCVLLCPPEAANCDGVIANGCETHDVDGDGVVCNDNCPSAFNPTQSDWNRDGAGDSCSPATDCQQCVNTFDWDSNGAYNAASHQCSQLVSLEAASGDHSASCQAKCTALRALTAYRSDNATTCLVDLCAGWDESGLCQ